VAVVVAVQGYHQVGHQVTKVAALAALASSLSPTQAQLNYSVVELLPNQAVNISIPLLLLVH
jgi:hypothetical protein